MRAVGKNTVLGCVYAMWREEFRNRYIKHLPPEERDAFAQKVINTYRKSWLVCVALKEQLIKNVVGPPRLRSSECH